MKIHFVDQDPKVADALAAAFSSFPEVTVSCADILAVAHTCVVSPANSHGFMDGGIDMAFRRYFGSQLEEKIRDAILRRPEGLLPVGASILLATGHAHIPFIIVAPTMEMPEAVGVQNCARAMNAILRIVTAPASPVSEFFCPGLATGVGGVAAKDAAEAMADAYLNRRTQSPTMR